MPLLSIKKSTLNLKKAVRQALRLSPTDQSSKTKKHDHEHDIPSTEPQSEKHLPKTQLKSSSCQQLVSSNIFVINSETNTGIYHEKSNRHEQDSLAFYNIIVDDGNKQSSLFRFESDITALEQLLKKHYGNIPSLPDFINVTNTPITTPRLTTSLVRNLTLRSLFTRTKTKTTDGERLEFWLRSCAIHPILGRSSELREFLSPLREQDTAITKPARGTMSQDQLFQHIHDSIGTAFINEAPVTLPIALLPEPEPQRQQSPALNEKHHLFLSTHAPAFSTENAEPKSVFHAPHYYSINDSVLDLSPPVSLSQDSIKRLTGTKFEFIDGDNSEKLQCNRSKYGNEGANCNDTDMSGDDEDILASLLPSPLGFTDDGVSASGANPSGAAHPLLMSSKKLAYPPPFGQVKTKFPPRPSSTKPLLSSAANDMDPTNNSQQTTRMTFEDLQCLKVLGKGCMGKVMLVRHCPSAKLYALKAISKEWVITQREIDHAMMERNILSKISKTHHPFLVKLHHSFQNSNQLFLVMDYHVGSDLATQLQLHYCFDPDRCRFYIAEILLGLQELHRLGILYRDLKPENVLLAADGHIVLIDFGFSRLFDQDEEDKSRVELYAPPSTTRQLYHTRTFCGTVEYMAVEMYTSEEYTFAVDYWSLGIILYEMILGYTPFDADTDAELYRRVLEDPVDIPEDIPPVTADLILGLLERNPKNRLGCAPFYDDGDDGSDMEFMTLAQGDLRQHPYFDSLNWSDVYNKRLSAPFVPHIKSETDVSHFDPDFIKLSPQLSVPGRHYDDDDDDPFDIDLDSKVWTSVRYGDCDDDQQLLDDAFAGYSYINENTCVDTDSILNEDTYQHPQQLNDSNSMASLCITDMASLEDQPLKFEGNGHTKNHYRGSICAAVTTPATVTSTALVTTTSFQYYQHQHHQHTAHT